MREERRRGSRRCRVVTGTETNETKDPAPVVVTVTKPSRPNLLQIPIRWRTERPTAAVTTARRPHSYHRLPPPQGLSDVIFENILHISGASTNIRVLTPRVCYIVSTREALMLSKVSFTSLWRRNLIRFHRGIKIRLIQVEQDQKQQYE